MIHQKSLQDLTEPYLKSLISEVVGSLSPDFDSFAPFGELGVDSFHVLKTIRKLESCFGALPKSLLFENFNINDLANYFVGRHEQTLRSMFAKELRVDGSAAHTNGRRPNPVEVPEAIKPPAAIKANGGAGQSAPIRILEKDAYAHPELQKLVQGLFDRFKIEGCVSRGTRKIAPNLFIGGAGLGYFNYGRSKDLILVYSYTGPRDSLPALLEEMHQYCETHRFQLNILTDKEIQPIKGVSFSATPFGVLQRVTNLKEFSLEGGTMRRLRYQVSKFRKSGVCKTEEYRCGSDPATDKNIVDVIDRWCAARTMVNPLVHDVKAEILAGAIGPEHRLFLTYLDDVLQNVILITAMSAEENGYLMDLEFYPPDMPMGGLEFAIAHILEVLAGEGCDVLSLGGTYGCKLESSVNADPEVDRILDDLRAQDIFNDAGNLQFKNKFRPETRTIYLCRPAGSANPDNVIDVIMMIADPLKTLTSDEENHNLDDALCDVATFMEEPAARRSTSSEHAEASSERRMIEGNERSRILADFGFNPLTIPAQHVEFDLKTDSWAQLQTLAIDDHMNRLRSQLQRPASVNESLRAIFPFAHFVLTESGQAAESALFKAWPKKGIALQNMLFPSTIFHQIDKGFTPREAPHPAVFRLNSREQYKGEMAWDEFEAQVARDPSAISFVCIEVNNNAAGGHPVSLRHLRDVKALLAEHSIPLMLDGTRVLENARFLIEQEKESEGKSLWAAAREILSYADVVFGSLTKDFCVSKGGLIAVNDSGLFQRLEEIVREEGGGVDLIDRKLIALSLQNRNRIEAGVLRRMENVRRIWQALIEIKAPVAQPAGGHAVLIDVKQIPEFKDFGRPVASFLAWLYLNTGIRASAHSVGMQKRTPLNDLVRLAVPIGLESGQVDGVIERLIHLFEKKANIPEIVMESETPQARGPVYANYRLIKYHNASGGLRSRTDSTAAVSSYREPAAQSGPTDSSIAGLEMTSVSFSSDMAPAGSAVKETEAHRVDACETPRPTQNIAVIGMAGRYPKAKNLGELWDNLAAGRDCIEEIPAARYERRLRHGSFEKYRGGFIEDVDKFDSLFFNISPREAEMLDPQERLFLETAWEAIEDAGYYPETLAGEGESRNIGVFVGAVWAMYQMLGVEERYAGNKTVPNSFLWSIANRVSYCFNLSGPSLTIDTACSSSLTAIYLACEAIKSGECSAAIVGGVNLDLHQAKFDINYAGGALSADGVCRSFGKGANGYVGGEGVGALVLKPLDRAVRDGDNIYGVIKSAVVNHGGRTSGYTVPNPKAQAGVIASALEKANVDARSIGYIEAHGTGTELGDPIEISGLNQVFGAGQVENRSCAVGSIKTNIGHLEAAAGVVSVSKALLQMKRRRIAPSLHSSELNEFIDFDYSPFYVIQRLEEWKNKEMDGVRYPLRAGISSFGAGGSNAHIILENYEPPENEEQEAAQPDELIFPLSAKHEDQLREAAVRFKIFVQESREKLTDIAHTLQIGRKSFEHRLAIVARTKEELLENLNGFIAGKKTDDILAGHVKSAEAFARLLNRREREEFIRLLLQGGDSRKIAALWAEGLLADWRGFQSNGKGKRISLPTYPFADKRHWADDKSPARRALQPAAGVHPMIDVNESTFERQLFKKTFHDRDFFIYDHHVTNVPTLPGVAYLELARKAGELAAGRKVQKIRNVLWVSPIAVPNSAPKEVSIELKPSGDAVQFEVFSEGAAGEKILHSQGKLLYATRQEIDAEPEYIDLESVRARCAKVIDGKDAYPLFKSFGLNLGPSFQVLQEVYKNENETLGVLKLPEFRQGDLLHMVLQPSLIDGSLQAGMGAQLGEKAGEMFVPFSIGEVEILHPLEPNCFSYVTEAQYDQKQKKENSRVVKSDVCIVNETGKVLVKIRESIGVPLREIHKQPAQAADGFSKLYYSYEWEKASLEIEERNLPHSIVLFDTEETLRELYQERLRKAGASSDHVILVRPGERFRDLGRESYEINPQNKGDFTRLFERLIENQRRVENICFAWPIGHANLHDEKSMERGVYSFLFVCQSLIRQKLESKIQLLYLYSAKQEEIQPHNQAVSGFINTLHLEHPKLLCKSVEVRRESDGYDRIFDAISSEFQARAQDATVVRYESQERYLRKLKAFELREAAASPSQGAGLREKGVYLITGGAGGLGLIFAEFLAKEHKARLVLTGRSELSAERQARLDELRKSGGEILYLPANVSSDADVKNLVSECKSRFGGLNGVIHAAGVLRDSLLRNKTPEEMSAVFAPKVYGTRYLDEATKQEELDFFVVFSSLAAVAGNAGQCDYSYANHFMDSLMAERELLRAKGARFGKSMSVNWSLWAGGGMKLDEQTELYFKKTLGINPLSEATGLEAFALGLASDRTQFACLEGVQEKVEAAWGLRKREPAPAAPRSSASFNQSAAAPVADEAGGDLVAWLQNELSQIVMEFLKLDAGDMSTDKILLDLGFDSIGLTTFANAINEKYQLDITPVLFFDYPTVDEIAKHLSVERESELRRFYQGPSPAAAIVASPETKQREARKGESETRREARIEIRKGWDPAALDRETATSVSGRDLSPELRFVNMPIAIIGASGVMPQSEDLEEFWENLKDSKDLITVVPPDRWRWEDYYGDPLKEANKSNSKWGGFMKEVDKFDPLFFGVSPREAEMMDPQQRIFLEHVWKAIEDSGHKVSDLAGTRTGVFVGVATNDYIDVMNGRDIALDGYSASGNSHSVLANRVSFLLNLRGPSAPIDTACSSSLVALHRAIESIHTGSCDKAIVGGVQVMLSPAAYISFGMAGMLSGDGKCKTFDKRADGYVRGEGCGAILIKPLAAAEADGNHIYAVIRATAENHGGRVTALTAPNSFAQTELLIEAYEMSQTDPTAVGYIECHGTGTSLGDPIEIQSLSKAFAELYKRRNKAPATVSHCGLASVKTNIGHLETGAGIAGLLKALLALKHKQIPANLHLEEINPYINLKGTPFYIADKLTPWEAPRGEDGSPRPRVAGVSSFGFGGANAHIVLEEYLPARREASAHEPQLIVLSAKNEDRLRRYAQSMRDYLEKHEIELADFAYTLQVGRDEMPARLALVVSSVEDLKQKFAEMIGGAGGSENVWRRDPETRPAKVPAAVDARQETLIRELIERKELSRLAELWMTGVKIDWRLLHKPGARRRISIPTYPFARERYWLPEGRPAGERRDQRRTAEAMLHPLVHRNTSTLAEQKFSSRFSGEEFYFADHMVETQKILPGVAYLEMARVAGELSGNSKVRWIRNLTWERPLVIEGEARDVEISLTPFKNEVKFAVRSGGGESVTTHCTGRLGYDLDAPGAEILDLARIRERCSDEVISGKDLYPFLSHLGLKLGRSFQIVQRIDANESEALAILELPEHLKEEADRFWLHPALMDGSLHTAIGLTKRNGVEMTLGLPYSVGEVQIFHSLRDLYYGYAVWAVENPKANQNVLKTTFHLLDRNGKVLARMKDFVSKPFRRGETKTITPARPAKEDQSKGAPAREEVKGGLQVLRPVWNPARFEAIEPIACPEASRILLLGQDSHQLNWVRESYPNSRLLDIASTSGIDDIKKTLGGCSFDQLLWIAPDVSPGAGRESSETLIEQQEEGVLTVFRIVKALLGLGYGDKELQWTIVVGGTQRVAESDPIQPAHAGIVGLAGSLAKEHPHWRLRLLDLDSLVSVRAQECLSLPWNKRGDALAHRRGEWFQQELALMETPVPAAPAYRRNGVYVVIGGAGGVGEAWSRFMIERYQANIVWIGRREHNALIEEKINSLSRLGPAPLYISADATNRAELQQALTKILETHPSITGVVHSALVLHDRSLARMEESGFRAGLSAKVDISVNLDRVFGGQKLDFILFFSSIISFFKTPGQSNYSAGCAFKDSFAQKLQRERAYPVKIMNWGYWGSVGVVAEESYNKLMAQMGVGSIEPEEGMTSLEALLGSEARQFALIKTFGGRAGAGVNISEAITRYPKTAPSVLPQAQKTLAERASGKAIIALEAAAPTPEMNALATEILASGLKSLGLFSGGIHRIAALSLDKQPAPYYERWLSVSIRYLQQQKTLAADLTFNHDVRSLATLWAEWEAKRSIWGADSGLRAQIAFLEACLKALPEILSGKQAATSVLFPNSSMRLIEGVYRDNVLADYFNEALGETLISCIEHQLQADKERKIRILEIGAGTGGTTAKLLPMLQRFPVAEYCYTDVSKAFLLYAEQHFKPRFPALTTAIFDVAKPLASQSIAADHYDFAVAANVLHATPEIRETLRNAKAALKSQGVLLLNEISAWSLFNHLTFGLLEGWWLHEDTAARLPGSPGLAPEKWREILAEEGFESIFFPAEDAHKFGQQIIAGSSDGWVRRRIAKNLAPQSAAGLQPVDLEAAEIRKFQERNGASLSGEPTEQMSNDYIRRIITQRLSEELRLDAAMIHNDAPFADYGVDSIIGVNLIRRISEGLQIELEVTTLFEYSTVNQLAEYILKNWRKQIAGRLAQIQDRSQLSGRSTDQTPPETEKPSQPRFIAERLFADERNAVGRENDEASVSAESIAVIGMSGRYAESESLDEFWSNLSQGKDLVKQVSRWSPADCSASENASPSYCSRGSFVDSIDRFDPAFFGISPQEAAYMDPQQRLFLEEAWKALEDAGYAGKSVHEKQCGVYVGCGNSNYEKLFTGDTPPHAFWGNSGSVVPARIAYHLDLQGAAIAVDTACSSSLVAIHLACQGLWSRETEMALAGGVFLQPTPGFYQVANHAGMLSAEGRCASFDARADGFTPGEGVGVVVLKRLRDALEDGDHIHGVIVGSGVNQDGRSNGLIAPNARSQERLERSVYDRFKINPETIQVVEAHATGTILGDSIEYGAISRAFREYTEKKQFCAIGTVKTNIGHSAAAAGVAGVLKLLLSLKHRRIPPSLHFQKSNPAIDFESGPFYVNTRLKDWKVEEGEIRRAAVSSFGFSGTNAHLVIEEAPSIDRAAVEAPGYVIALSARSPEQLQRQVRNLLARVKAAPELSMNDLSFTLFVGRMHLSHRLSCLARNRKELISLLDQWVETGAASQVYTSEIQEGKVREQVSLKRFGDHCIQECRNTPDAAVYLEHLATIADLYLQGYSLDFQALFSRDSRRAPLPVYPFARERCWVEAAGPARPTSTANATPPFRMNGAAKPAAAQPVWLFSIEPPSETGDDAMHIAMMRAEEKMELFFKQEIALQLHRPLDEISTSLSYFDLGLSSLGITNLIQKTNQLLGEHLSPGVLFEHTNIRSLAGYLASTFPSKIDALTAIRQATRRDDSAKQPQILQENSAPLNGDVFFSEKPDPLPHGHASDGRAHAELNGVHALEKILWREDSLDEDYEIATF